MYTEKETDRQTERETETERERKRKRTTEKERNRERERLTARETDRLKQRQDTLSLQDSWSLLATPVAEVNAVEMLSIAATIIDVAAAGHTSSMI